MYFKNSKDTKNPGNESPHHAWNLNSNVFQQATGTGKSKEKQKLMSTRGYGKESDSPSKDQYQKLKKNIL